MSSTYTLGCVDCGARIWVGQGTTKPYLYATPDHVDALQRFLALHMGHHLVYYLDGCEPEAFQEENDEERLIAERDGRCELKSETKLPWWTA